MSNDDTQLQKPWNPDDYAKAAKAADDHPAAQAEGLLKSGIGHQVGGSQIVLARSSTGKCSICGHAHATGCLLHCYRVPEARCSCADPVLNPLAQVRETARIIQELTPATTAGTITQEVAQALIGEVEILRSQLSGSSSQAAALKKAVSDVTRERDAYHDRLQEMTQAVNAFQSNEAHKRYAFEALRARLMSAQEELEAARAATEKQLDEGVKLATKPWEDEVKRLRQELEDARGKITAQQQQLRMAQDVVDALKERGM